jgi:hypothetical protein
MSISIDEAGEGFHRHLPTARHQLALQPAHAACNEGDQHHGGNQHPQGAVGERDIVAREFPTRQWRNGELVHRIDLGRFG